MAKIMEELLEEALVSVEEQPYEVPENWIWSKLLEGGAECLDKFRKPINARERDTRVGNIPYYGATGQVGWIDDYLTDEELVLVGEDGAPFYELLKNKAYIIEGKAWVNNHAHILKSYYGHYGNLYLMHYLNQFNYHGYVNGTTRLKLTQGNMKKIPIPIPPLQEQQRIVNKIESLFSKIDKAKELIDEAREGFENRKAAILSKAFRGELTESWREDNLEINAQRLVFNVCTNNKAFIDDEYKIPNNWGLVNLDTICNFKNGLSKRKGSEGHQTIVLRLADIQNDTFLLDECREIMLTEIEKENYKVSSKELLIIRVNGSKGLVGKAVFYDYDIDVAFCDHLIRLDILESINKQYLFRIWNSNIVRLQLEEKIVSSAGQNTISQGSLKSIIIPLPPLEEQKEIVRILDNLLSFESEIDELTQLEDQIELLKKSILAKAFRGELGTNDSTEESATQLLKEALSRK